MDAAQIFSDFVVPRITPVWREFTSPNERGFWLYLLSALALAALQFKLRARTEASSPGAADGTLQSEPRGALDYPAALDNRADLANPAALPGSACEDPSAVANDPTLRTRSSPDPRTATRQGPGALADPSAEVNHGPADVRESCSSSFLGWCFPDRAYAHVSAKLDCVYFIANKILFSSLLTPLLAVSIYTSSTSYVLLTLAFGERAHSGPTPLVLWVVYTFIVLLAFDFGAFYAHYLQHRFRWLWEFHKVHHSAKVLTPVTVYRVHPVDDVLNAIIPAALAGFADGIFVYFEPGFPPRGLSIFQVNLFLFFFYLFGFDLRHSHVWVSYGPKVSQILISPAQHQIHHSEARRHWGRNLGYIFAFWDKLFGTLYVPENREQLSFGLGKGEEEEYSSVAKLYLLPFKKLARSSRRRSGYARADSAAADDG